MKQIASLRRNNWLYCIAFSVLTACGSQDGVNTSVAVANNASSATNYIALTAANVQTDSGLLKSLETLYPNGQLPADRTAQTSKERLQNPAALKLTTETAATAKSQSSTSTAKPTLTTQTVAAQAAAADYKPVTRLQMPTATLYGAYFFTIYDAERDAALASNANWKQEGPAFWASVAAGEGLNPVHRYRNLFNGSYIYTIYDSERSDIAAIYASSFAYEGVAWYASQTQSQGWSPLYRFRNLTNNTYLSTAYEAEKDAIVAGYSAVFTLEGIAYYVRQDAPDGTAPVITILGDNPQSLTAGTAYVEAGASCTDNKDTTCTVTTTGTVNTASVGTYTITYTATDTSGNTSSKTRTVNVIAGIPPVVPDTTAPTITVLGTNPLNLTAGTAYTEAGATCVDNKDTTCTVVTTGTVNTGTAGTYTITYTATDAAGNASSKTRAVTVAACTAEAIGSTGYSLVFKGCSAANVAEYYAKDECVRDNATGLIWQGQTGPDTDLRGNDQYKTNYDSTSGNQNYNRGNPIPATQAQIDAPTNSIGFKTAVNATNLCGSSAWRLPTKEELFGIVKANESPTIDNLWFPNTPLNPYWSASPNVGYAYYAWYVDFNYALVYNYIRGNALPVRLVRASQ